MYQDDENYLSLGRAFSGSKQIRYTEGRNGRATDKNYTDTISPQDIHLKIEKAGDKYSAFYSSDGETWASAGSIDSSVDGSQSRHIHKEIRTCCKERRISIF